MRLALIADIHGNLEALEAVLSAIQRAAVDRILCLGDIVGYGANPAECIAGIRERGIECIAGNHDFAASGAMDMAYFNAIARTSAEWTQRQLSAEETTYLRSLPLRHTEEEFDAVHGAFEDPGAFGYVLTSDDARCSMECVEARVGFVAHSHVPMGFLGNGQEISATRARSFVIPDGDIAIVNIGSVGQPRDHLPLAAFALYDTESRLGEIRRVSYDVAKAGGKIIAAGLPPMNAFRLFEGE